MSPAIALLLGALLLLAAAAGFFTPTLRDWYRTYETRGDLKRSREIVRVNLAATQAELRTCEQLRDDALGRVAMLTEEGRQLLQDLEKVRDELDGACRSVLQAKGERQSRETGRIAAALLKRLPDHRAYLTDKELTGDWGVVHCTPHPLGGLGLSWSSTPGQTSPE